MDYKTLCIQPLDHQAMERARQRLDALVKPLNSLGELENSVVQLAGIQQTDRPAIDRRYHVVMCADNGVFEEGVSRSERQVTRQVAENFAVGKNCAGVFAAKTHSQMLVYDVGIDTDDRLANVIDRKIRHSTGNIAKGPAMTLAEMEQAVQVGLDAAALVKRQGGQIITTGEMGVCNTTTAAAMACVLCGLEPQRAVGRGAGLTRQAHFHKIEVVSQAIAVNHPDPKDPEEVLCTLGGFDIAGLTGVFLGGAASRIPVVADGLISTVAALLASMMAPGASDYFFASHLSDEPAGQAVLERLGKKAAIHQEMRLGEGTGALMYLEILDFALRAYEQMPTFEQTDIMVYDPLD